MKWVSNLPPPEAVPFPFLTDEPSIKTIARYIRPSDYISIFAIGLGFPAALMAMERYSPTINPRLLPRILCIQVPFFLSCGALYAAQNTVMRFWGWHENSREVAMWEQERPQRESNPPRQRTWSETDW